MIEEDERPITEVFDLDLTDHYTKLFVRCDYWRLRALKAERKLKEMSVLIPIILHEPHERPRMELCTVDKRGTFTPVEGTTPVMLPDDWWEAVKAHKAVINRVAFMTEPQTQQVKPDGYAVIMPDESANHGYWFVGIWHDKAIADDHAKRQGRGSAVRPVALL